MSRRPLRSFAFLVVLVTLLGSLHPAAAQDATPPAQQAGAPEGVAPHTLASGTMDILAPGSANLVFGRIRLAPGATLPFDPTDPTVDLVLVSAGTLTFRVEAPMTVERGTKAGTPVATAPEAIPAGTEFTLSDGDSAFFPPNVAGEARNDGAEEATAWVVSVALLASEAVTPTP